MNDWTRTSTGNYVMIADGWVLSVGRNNAAYRGHQWYVETWPVSDPDNHGKQLNRREGLSSMKAAKAAAISTHCFRCGRRFPLYSLELAYPHRPGRTDAWKCRDHGPCEAEHKRLVDVDRADAKAARRMDHKDIYLRQDEHDPEMPQLVFDSGTNGFVVNMTDNDLDKLTEILIDRASTRYKPHGPVWKLGQAQPAFTEPAGNTYTSEDIKNARIDLRGECTCAFTPVGPDQFIRPETDPQCPVHNEHPAKLVFDVDLSPVKPRERESA
jgi:hypothetical protein